MYYNRRCMDAKKDDFSPRHMVTGVVLAGGSSGRFGADKRTVKIGDRTMFQHVADILRGVFDNVFAAVGGPSDGVIFDETPAVRDVFPGSGPLAGIHAGLSIGRTPYIFVAGCDMPLIKAGLVRHMASLTPGFDAVAPIVNGRIEPLHAVYASICRSRAQELLEGGEGAPRALLNSVNTRYVEEEELRRFDPDLAGFIGVNTPDDLEEVKRRLAISPN